MLVLLASACGRPATAEDCEAVIERIVELELEGTRTGEQVKQAAARARQDFKQRAATDCVGRRIRSDAVACARIAKTPEQLIEDCLGL
jgi:uncharacterized protein YoaH (UPF0181 family)